MDRYFLDCRVEKELRTIDKNKAFKVFTLLEALDYKYLYKELVYLKKYHSNEEEILGDFGLEKHQAYKAYLQHKDIIRLNVDYMEAISWNYYYICLLKRENKIGLFSSPEKSNPADFPTYYEPISLYNFLLEIYFNIRKKVSFFEKCLVEKHKYREIYEMGDDEGYIQVLKCDVCGHYKLNNHLKNI